MDPSWTVGQVHRKLERLPSPETRQDLVGTEETRLGRHAPGPGPPPVPLSPPFHYRPLPQTPASHRSRGGRRRSAWRNRRERRVLDGAPDEPLMLMRRPGHEDRGLHHVARRRPAFGELPFEVRESTCRACAAGSSAPTRSPSESRGTAPAVKTSPPAIATCEYPGRHGQTIGVPSLYAHRPGSLAR